MVAAAGGDPTAPFVVGYERGDDDEDCNDDEECLHKDRDRGTKGTSEQGSTVSDQLGDQCTAVKCSLDNQVYFSAKSLSARFRASAYLVFGDL